MAASPDLTTDDRATRAQIASGISFELFAGAIAAALAVLGLAGYFPVYMAATAAIAIGFALVAQGGALAARWQQATHIPATERTEAVGIGTEVLGGLAAVALGVLALLEVAPLILLPVAAFVIGAALLLGGPTQPELVAAGAARRFRVTRDTVRTASSVMVTAGVGAIVLGALGFVFEGYVVVLALIAMLCVAVALVATGGALTARFGRRFA